MRRILIITISIIAICLIAIIIHIFSLKRIAPTENYPNDTYLDNVQNKKALVIVAHDDDATLFAGTTSKLAEEGWEVNFMCFYPYHWRPEETPIRRVEMSNIARIQGLRSVSLVDLEIRNRLDTVRKPWMPISYEQFAGNFNIDSIRMFVSDAIVKTGPDVIFILDNVIGLYGHPEHVVIGKIVENYCRSYHSSIGFSVRRIYMGVLPPSQAEEMMGKTDTYTDGKNIYNCNGMPLPNVQINIYPYATKKKSVLLAHASQHRNIKKLFPSYKYIPSKIYFKLFDTEYFNIIEL